MKQTGHAKTIYRNVILFLLSFTLCNTNLLRAAELKHPQPIKPSHSPLLDEGLGWILADDENTTHMAQRIYFSRGRPNIQIVPFWSEEIRVARDAKLSGKNYVLWKLVNLNTEFVIPVELAKNIGILKKILAKEVEGLTEGENYLEITSEY